jgi:hypothetical protein
MKKLYLLIILLGCGLTVQAQCIKNKSARKDRCAKKYWMTKGDHTEVAALVALASPDIFEKKCCLTGKVSYVKKVTDEVGETVFVEVEFDRIRRKFVPVKKINDPPVKV